MLTAQMDREKRRLSILAALGQEIRRQARADMRQIDIEALADAVDRALEEPAPQDVDELSREPDELNAANDV